MNARSRNRKSGRAARPTAADSEGVVIRAMVPRDGPAVIALDARNTGVAKPGYWNAMFRRPPPGHGTRCFLIAERGRALVGFAVGEVRAWEFGSPPCGWVFAIHVDQNTRLRKIGTRLLEAIAAAFRREGVTKLRTMLARNDQLNLRFFRSQGMMAGPFIQLEKELRG